MTRAQKARLRRAIAKRVRPLLEHPPMMAGPMPDFDISLLRPGGITFCDREPSVTLWTPAWSPPSVI